MKSTPRGYVKFGMYTEIRDMRTIYFDAVRFSNFLDRQTMEEWVNDQAHLPSISITAPRNESQVATGSTFTTTVEASDPGGKKLGTAGGVTKVEFFADNCSMMVDTIAPFSALYSLGDGPHTLNAIVTDTDGNTRTSETVDIYVGPKPPRATLLSPLKNDNFVDGQSIELQSEVIDVEGRGLVLVEFFEGANSIGATNTATTTRATMFKMLWTPSKEGAYMLRVVGTDQNGKRAQSKAVPITVGATLETSTVTAVEDASLREGNPGSTANWGNLEVYGNPGAQIVSVVKFDTSAFSQTKEFRKATLKLYTTSLKTKGSVFAVFAVTSGDWVESQVTWSTGPTRAAKIAHAAIQHTGEYVAFDVTSYLSDKLKASDLVTTTFWIEDNTQMKESVEFHSHIKSNPPLLEVSTSDVAAVDEISLLPDNGDSCAGGTGPDASPPSSLSPTSSPTAPPPCDCDAACKWNGTACQKQECLWCTRVDCHFCINTPVQHAAIASVGGDEAQQANSGLFWGVIGILILLVVSSCIVIALLVTHIRSITMHGGLAGKWPCKLLFQMPHP